MKKFIPLISIISVVILFSLFTYFYRDYSNFMQFMRLFMAWFFIIFGAFKVINWKGFVDAYQMYDVLAKRSRTYAFVYPLIELGIGFAYLFNFNPLLTNLVTLLVMSIGMIGVVQALNRKEEITCACLGAVFKIPMTKVTLFEDLTMAVMALVMLII